MAANRNYINREISWLSFNERVLQEAADPSVPLLERLKFLGIFSNNLDEFFRVRVATLKRMVNAGIGSSKATAGQSPKKVLKKIHDKVMHLRERFDLIFNQTLEALEQENIYMINEKELSPEQHEYVLQYFADEVRPRLVPIMLDKSRPFPRLENQVIYLAIKMQRTDEPKNFQYALIELLTDVLPRFVQLPDRDGKKMLIMLDDVIRIGLPDIFVTLNYDRFDAYTIKLTRDAEFDISDDITKSFYEKIAKSIKQREQGQAVRFVYDREMPEDLLHFVLKKNALQNFENLIPGGRYHNARDFIRFPTMGLDHLVYPDEEALAHRDLLPKSSLFESIRQRDILLHYPYQSFHYIIDLLREAAIDPRVKSIKITLYRVAKYSNVVNALINAIRNGKKVTAVMELQARFDEEANIYWTNELADEGAHILSGIPGLKVHAKLCQITRRENDEDVHYTYIATGNFNETTATIYSDHGLFTSHEGISKEVSKLFDFMEHNYKNYNYRHILVSPFYMRRKLKKLIRAEIKNAKAGKEAYILIKLNNLVDTDLIDKLYQAGNAGVKIKMLVRGICSIIPGEKGLSENIEVYSIVDKYLEHSRIMIFCHGGNEQYYLTSADWMIRNLDNRIEVATPVYDENVRRELKEFMEIQLRDRVKSRIINAAQDNPYRRDKDGTALRAQEEHYRVLKDKLKSLRQEAV